MIGKGQPAHTNTDYAVAAVEWVEDLVTNGSDVDLDTVTARVQQLLYQISRYRREPRATPRCMSRWSRTAATAKDN